MMGPYKNDSLVDSRRQVSEKRELEISKLEPDDLEHHYGGIQKLMNLRITN